MFAVTGPPSSSHLDCFVGNPGISADSGQASHLARRGSLQSCRPPGDQPTNPAKCKIRSEPNATKNILSVQVSCESINLVRVYDSYCDIGLWPLTRTAPLRKKSAGKIKCRIYFFGRLVIHYANEEQVSGFLAVDRKCIIAEIKHLDKIKWTLSCV